MATNNECMLTVEQRVQLLIQFLDQKIGETTMYTNEKLVYGYEEEILKNIKTKQSQYSSIIQYNKGDIVTFENSLYIAKTVVVNELPSNTIYFKKMEFDKELSNEKHNVVGFVTVKDGVISASKNIDINNSNLDDGDGYKNWSFLFTNSVLSSYNIQFSEITKGDQALGSSKSGFRRIRDKTSSGFGVQFQTDSVSYNDMTILIYGILEA